MQKHVDKLLNYLEVKQLGDFKFEGTSPTFPERVFGGQVLAQALNSAARCVDPKIFVHSMHAYFLRPGDPKKIITFEVDPIRDGASFVTRRVVAEQSGRAIFNTSISFQKEETGLNHQIPMKSTSPPEELETDFEFWKKFAKDHPNKAPPPQAHAIERRVVDRRDYINPEPRHPSQKMWFKVLGELGDNPLRHATLLAYISDYSLLSAALQPHPYTSFNPELQLASLDHSIWFHRPFRADEYLLYDIDSPNSHGSRGFSRGSFYTRDGILIASTAQESLMRLRI